MNKKWVLRSNDFKTSPVNASIHSCDKSEAMVGGAGQLLKFWVMAFFCIFIPVLHFFLVPGLFLIGIYVFLKSTKFKFHISQSGSADCPCCHNQIELKELWFESQVRFSCQHCSEQLVLEVGEWGAAKNCGGR